MVVVVVNTPGSQQQALEKYGLKKGQTKGLTKL